MRFVETALRDVLLIEPQPNVDGRGYFSRAFCQLECAQAGITCHFVQDNLSYNERAGTFRGMHFQKEPYGEDKLLRCIAGGIDDVIVGKHEFMGSLRKKSMQKCKEKIK